jgi:ribosomal protein L16 Arg81 hydroxylase
MADDSHNGGGPSRLDRLEGLMEMLVEDHVRFQEQHKQLLTAQIVLTDRVDKMAQGILELRESQKHTDERFNALITIVDDLIHLRPAQ